MEVSLVKSSQYPSPSAISATAQLYELRTLLDCPSFLTYRMRDLNQVSMIISSYDILSLWVGVWWLYLLHCQDRDLEPVCQLSDPQISPLNSPNFHLLPPRSLVNKHSSIAYSVPGTIPTFKAPELLMLALFRDSPKTIPFLCFLLLPQVFLSSLSASCVSTSLQDRV